ncbi:MAG: IS110 family transposase [Acetobacteraceae bacterium]|nr:IS110 family transposase [Acetobacteraceae bacterium]
MVEGTEGSHHKEGSTKMAKRITICAGIDTGKRKLDVALDGSQERLEVENTTEGHKSLVEWLRRHKVKRVGIEASGGYEQPIVAELRRKRFVVVVFQPAQVRAYAKYRGQRAKNDRIDAALIAACTAEAKEIHPAPDPRLSPFAEHLTMIDQIGEDVARVKNRLESCRDERIRQAWMEEISRLARRRRTELEALTAAIRKHPDLARRLELILSVRGAGLPTAVAVLVRMPEIGQINRAQAAALAGLAPYDDDSGEQIGVRHIEGGRERLRHAVYAAALPASFRWNPQLIALYQRLIAAGKGHKRALVACARKLLIFINTVVARGTPWQDSLPAVASMV